MWGKGLFKNLEENKIQTLRKKNRWKMSPATYESLCSANYSAISECFFGWTAFQAPHLSSGEASAVRRTRDKPEAFVEEWCALWVQGRRRRLAMLKVGGSARFVTQRWTWVDWFQSEKIFPVFEVAQEQHVTTCVPTLLLTQRRGPVQDRWS